MAGKRQERTRRIEYQFDEVGRVINRDEVQQALLDFEAVLAAVGGIMGVGAIRAVAPDGTYLTVGVNIEWASYAPAVGTVPVPELPADPPPVSDDPDLSGAMEQALETAEDAAEPELDPVA